MIGQIIERFDIEAYIRYLTGLTNTVPVWVYVLLISILFISTISILLWKGTKKGLVLIAWIFLIEYYFLVVCSTVFFRQFSERRPVELRLFWSYQYVLRGGHYLIYENIMNVVVFVPIGCILCGLLPLSKWWVTVIVGISLSVMVELMQLGFHRGLCELDDVIHNAAGCLVGILVACFIKVIAKYYERARIQRQRSIYV